MNTGDPLSEAVGWNAAGRMVTSGTLAGADFAGLVTRRIGAAELPPAAGVEVLLDGGGRERDVGAGPGGAAGRLAGAVLRRGTGRS